MKSRTLSMILLAFVILVSAVPSLAQSGEVTEEADEPQTIMDVVIEATEAESAEFTTLLAAIEAADPTLMELLHTPSASVTVFAPTDVAFADAFDAMGMSAEEVLEDTALLNDLLRYHISPVSLNSSDIEMLDNAYLGTLLPNQLHRVNITDDKRITVEEATVVTPDTMATNGVIHTIDTVLTPPEDNILGELGETLEEVATMGNIVAVVTAANESDTPELTVLLSALQAADPSLLDLLNGTTPMTVLAPTDKAFETAFQELGISADDALADQELLDSTLSYHVLPGEIETNTIRNLIEANDGEVQIATMSPGNTVTFLLDADNLIVNDAIVVDAGTEADNGVIHTIEAVLLPDTE